VHILDFIAQGMITLGQYVKRILTIFIVAPTILTTRRKSRASRANAAASLE